MMITVYVRRVQLEPTALMIAQAVHNVPLVLMQLIMEVPVVQVVLKERINLNLNKHLVLVVLRGNIMIKQDQHQKVLVQIVLLVLMQLIQEVPLVQVVL